VQIILWDWLADEVVVLPDSCGGDSLHESEVYLTEIGTRSSLTLKEFLILEKKKTLKEASELFPFHIFF
jgi:hypothetical protein